MNIQNFDSRSLLLHHFKAQNHKMSFQSSMFLNVRTNPMSLTTSLNTNLLLNRSLNYLFISIFIGTLINVLIKKRKNKFRTANSDRNQVDQMF